MTQERAERIRQVRRRLAQDGPVWTRGPELDFETVTLPERDCDRLRDLPGLPFEPAFDDFRPFHE